MELRVALLAGELSGDRLGAELMRAVRLRRPGVTFTGVGGPRMRRDGLAAVADFDRLGVNGFAEPIRRLPDLLRLLRTVRRDVLAFRPHAFVGVDFNVFNNLLERQLKARGVPTAHYVSPSVYAWRRGRIRRMHRAVDLMLSLFPFELPFYEGCPLTVRYVGHPLADAIERPVDRGAARARLGLPADAPVLGVFPGSRGSELRALGPDFLAAAGRLAKELPGLHVAVAVARPDFAEPLRALARAGAPGVPVRLCGVRSRDVHRAADVVLTKAGTSCLEAALVGRPMVVAYRLGRLAHALVRRIKTSEHVAMPNILAGRRLVPELLQDEITPDALAGALAGELRRFRADRTLAEAFEVQYRLLRRSASDRAAEAVLDLAEGRLPVARAR